jgi:carboxypeptidase T
VPWPTDRFPSAQEIYDRLRELAANDRYDEIVKVFDFETVAGKGGPTQGNEGPRTTNYARIGPQASGTGRVTVVFTGGVHAREWSPPTLLVNFIEKLAEAYAAGSSITIGGATTTAAQVRNIVEKVDLFIAPLINADGYEWSRNPAGERMWRKNRRPPPASVPPHCGTCGGADPHRFGVDINRNFDVIWQFLSPTGTDGTFSVAGVLGNMSCNPCEFEVYVGESAASERETQNVVFLLNNNPQYYIDVHMKGRKIYHSWGTDDNRPIPGPTPALQTTTPRDGFGGVTKDDINEDFLREIRDTIGNRMADATGLGGGARNYDVVLSSSLGAFSGASDDYAMSRNLPTVPGARQPIRSYTVECGITFLDTFRGEFQTTQREVHALLLSLLSYAVSPAGLRAADLVPTPAPTPPPPPRPTKSCNCQIAPGTPGEDDL